MIVWDQAGVCWVDDMKDQVWDPQPQPAERPNSLP